MKYLYKKILPFEYKIYADILDIPLSEESKNKLGILFDKIRGIDNAFWDETCKEKLKQYYGEISEGIVNEIRKSGNKKSKHVLEEVEFLFVCSYLLIKECGFSQKELAYIWGMREKDFARLDIHPKRSYNAYTKLDSECGKKTLIPENYKSSGIRIAECMNRKIQAIHTCCKFIGITNDLDIFANIASEDKKAYILTKPSRIEWDNAEDKVKASMSYAGYFLAMANNLEGNYCAGKIKSEIISLLNMEDNTILEKSDRIDDLLLENDDYQKYLVCEDKKLFEDKLWELRKQIELSDNIDMNAEIPDDLFDEDLEEIGINRKEVDFGNPAIFNDCLKEKTKQLKCRLRKYLSYQVRGQFDKDAFMDWRIALLKVLCETIKTVEKLELDEKKKVRAAAIYWVLQVFGVEEVEEKGYNLVKQYLDSGKLLIYLDAINKEIRKGERTHVLFKEDDFDIKSYLISENMWKKEIRPLLIYIDAKDYKLDRQCVEKITEHGNVLLVVHSENDLDINYGMRFLDKELKLYIREANDGNNKKM